MRARDILQEFKYTPPSQQNIGGESVEVPEEFKADIEHRLTELEQKVKYGLASPEAPDLNITNVSLINL